MKAFTFASTLALATVVCAQSSNPSLIPDCAKSCLGDINSLGSEIGCGQFNYKCICSNQSFISALSCCVSKKCSPADQKATLDFANTVCQVADVTLPTAASCAPGEQPTGLNGAGGSASGSSGSSTGTGSSSTTGTTSGSTTGSGSMSMTAAGTGGSSASAATGSTTPTSTSSKGAAGNLVAQGAGTVGGFAMALAALL